MVATLWSFRAAAAFPTSASCLTPFTQTPLVIFMLAAAFSCLAWQVRQPVPRRLLSGASFETAKVPIDYPGVAGKPGTAGLPLRAAGASTMSRMRPVDMALDKATFERMLGMPLVDVVPFALSRLGVFCCYAFPHVAFISFLCLLDDCLDGTPETLVGARIIFVLVGIFPAYIAVINAVGAYIANLDVFTSQAVGVSNSIASTFGVLFSRLTAFMLVVIAPIAAFSFFGLYVSGACVYLSFTIGVGRYFSAVLFP